jgi:aryl-alcohol dehydrogenase-like predicted oxidoreductase
MTTITTITKIALGKNGPLVSKLGLGCMRMSPVWGGPVNDESESIATIQMALDSGINFLNTGDFYGSGHNELLVGKAIKGRRDDAFISVKFGAVFYGRQWLGLDLRPIAIKNFINYSLVRLGIDTIDLYQPCRLDDSVPVEDVIGTVADLIKEGKVRYLGVSEITAAQLRKAHNVYPVTALEIGYSLADRQIERDLLPTAKELGIGVVAFANTAEGLLTGEMKAPLPANSYQHHFPRFQGDKRRPAQKDCPGGANRDRTKIHRYPQYSYSRKRFSACFFSIRDSLCSSSGRSNNKCAGHAKSKRGCTITAAYHARTQGITIRFFRTL